MDFGALPPEVNSAKMYSGSGAGSMLAAAAAWDGIAEDLYFTAGRCDAVISLLAGEAWLGPASVSMVAATAPYLAWLNATAAQAQQTAAQARAAAGAFEAAFAATVPPPAIAANRLLLATLTATNILGINTPAIAATEAHYLEMWAQDAAAMYGYAGAAGVASTLTQFTPPAEITDEAGLGRPGREPRTGNVEPSDIGCAPSTSATRAAVAVVGLEPESVGRPGQPELVGVARQLVRIDHEFVDVGNLVVELGSQGAQPLRRAGVDCRGRRSRSAGLSPAGRARLRNRPGRAGGGGVG